MKRECLLFLAERKIDRERFSSALASAGIVGEVSFLTEKEGAIYVESFPMSSLESLLPRLHEIIGTAISFLKVPKDSTYERKLLKEALAYFPNRLLFPSDIIMKEMSFGDYASLKYLSSLFKGLDEELLLTSGAYLRAGLDACLAAKTLFIHRNTFNYRLAKFIDKTGIDIRDYHNALLLELYFQFGSL